MGVTGTEAPPDGQYDNLRAKTKQVEREMSYSHMVAQGGLSKKAKKVQEDSTCKGIQGSTSKEEIKCVCLNARSIINLKDELNIMVDDIKPHIIGITESWANNDITDAELGLEGYAMFRKDRMGRRGGVLLYIKDKHTSI